MSSCEPAGAETKRAAPPLIEQRYVAVAEGTDLPRRQSLPRAWLMQLLILALLTGIALLAVFVWPEPSADLANDAVPPTPAATAPTAPPAMMAPAENPAARLAAQARLQEALARLASLQERQAARWAKTAMHELDVLLAEGERAYREQRYALAQERYQAVLDGAARLDADIPARVIALVDGGRLALADGDSAAALAAFNEANAMAPDDAVVRAGLRRAGTLDQVLALTAQAESYERMPDVEQALAAYREAVALDSEATAANSALARLERAQRRVHFNDAMSAGLAALARADFTAARAGFKRAGAIDRMSPELKAAELQLEHDEIAAAIEHHMTLARRAVATEQWRTAQTQFDAALQRDPTLSEAADGRTEAVSRRRIDEALSAHLADTSRLADKRVQAEVRALLGSIRKRQLAGKRLAAELIKLDSALRQANIPVTVALRSDGETAVSVERLGEFGRFAQRGVELLPGHYVAFGKRDGYREARVEFTVTPGATDLALTVICDIPTQARP